MQGINIKVLQEICIKSICLLYDINEKNLLSDKKYKKHVKLKLNFLNDMDFFK